MKHDSSKQSSNYFPSPAVLALLLLAAASLYPPVEAPRIVVVVLFVGLLGGAQWCWTMRQRAGIFGRFVSPNVARAISGGASTADHQAEISIVCADIRNFTRFSSAVESARVMQLLREYYEAVGSVVTDFGGTVKDYAGDGILVLVGAPQSMADHADRAVNMALAIREAAQEVTQRWSQDGLELGIGVGVASGEVTVGVVGGPERVEYAAVGPAVNLAARLCGKADTGQILLDERTRELARVQKGRVPLRAGGTLRLKGIPAPVASFIV